MILKVYTSYVVIAALFLMQAFAEVPESDLEDIFSRNTRAIKGEMTSSSSRSTPFIAAFEFGVVALSWTMLISIFCIGLANAFSDTMVDYSERY